MNIKKKIRVLAFLSLILIAAFILIGLNSNNWLYLLSRRIPKVAAIVITGGAITFSSMIFQTITNNRILTPSVLGLDSLYMLIQTFIVFILGSSSMVVINKNINFVISTGLMVIFSWILYRVLFKKEKNNVVTLLLVGLILGTLFQSISSFMQMMIDPNEFLHIQDKMFASFNNVNTNILMLSVGIVLFIGLYSYRYMKVLDVLSLGREHSINLGVDHDQVVKIMLFIISILVSVSTALVGPITFLGLLVVNLTREFLGTYKHKYLIMGSVLMSILALVGGQFLVERIFNFGTPISVIINFIGGVYFIYLLLKENVA